MNAKRSGHFVLTLMCAATIAGCGRTAAPHAPQPQTVSGITRDGTHYTFLKWNEGLAIMLVDQSDVHNISGSSGTGKPDRRKGSAAWLDRESNEWQHGYEWQLNTTDGKTAVLSLDDVKYDLLKGAVFRIDISGDDVSVQQLDRDLSNIQPNKTSCDNFVTADPELTRIDQK